MSLEEYKRKRDFTNTPEPPPASTGEKSTKAAKTLPYFCVQRHDATRLHYDFRLEIGGVLKSWAVPKGPSLDPSQKRFAAHVEDHPLDYGGFEGNIPAGNYGAGSVMLWDRGGFEVLEEMPAEQQLARGDLKIRLHGEKLKGDFAVVHMKGSGKGNDWLLIKKRDGQDVPGWDVEDYAWSVLSGRTQEEIAQGLPARTEKQKAAGEPDRIWQSKPAAKARAQRKGAKAPEALKKKTSFDPAGLSGAVKAEMPASIEPMKAALAESPPRGDDWLFEVKWDGVRAICFIEGERVRLMSRTGHACEKQYPELSVVPHYLAAGRAIVDGEIAVLDEKGVARFELIQSRISVGDANTIAHLARSRPVTYFAFDLLYLDGYDLRRVALIDRKRALEAILTPTDVLRYSEHFAGAGQQMLEAAGETGIEGILAKRANSFYEPRRSREWLKLKVVSQQEFLICGFTEGERDYFSSLVLGYHENGRLLWAGNVGTGFDQKMLANIYRRLEPLIVPRSPFAETPKMLRQAIWVRPELVCMIRFTNWTQDNRLRAPVFLGLRADADPKEVFREKPEQPQERRKVLLSDSKDEASLRIDDKPLKFTNLNKVFYPEEGYTKRDVLNYYDAVADLILPYLKDRPLSLKRYPNGIHEEFFFQKDVPQSFASWLRTELIDSEERRGKIRYVFAEDRASLLYLVNLACIDHNPWMSRFPDLDHPDFILIDLDPQECSFDRIVEAAQLVRKKLDAIGLEGCPKTTGGDGLHIYIPVEPVYTYEEVRSFAEILARLLTAERPDLFTTPRSVSRREKGKVYFDYLQNAKSKTISAPYVLRAYPGAPVAAPLRWNEVKKGLLPSDFTLRNAVDRFMTTGDLFAPVLNNLQTIEEPLEKLTG